MLLLLQIGQCGNQVGEALLEKLFEATAAVDESNSSAQTECYFERNLYFRLCPRRMTEEDTTATRATTTTLAWQSRALAIDTETKVIRSLSQNGSNADRRWCYNEKNCICQKAGSANNWAFGYHRHGPKLYPLIRKRIQQEIRDFPHFGGFLIMQSLAGGTGSGLGSYITEKLRQDFPCAFIMNQVIWPYATGEVIVQNYNTILTLAHLYKSSDSILIFQNDHLHQVCKERLGVKKVSFQDLNGVIADALASILLPSQSASTGRRLQMPQLMAHLCPDPRYKLLTIKHLPLLPPSSIAFETHRWDSLLKHLLQMMILDAATDERLNWSLSPLRSDLFQVGEGRCKKLLAACIVFRGKDVPGHGESEWRKMTQLMDELGFRQSYLYTDICHYSDTLWRDERSLPLQVFGTCRSMNSLARGVSAISNSTSLLPMMDDTLVKALRMYQCGAFVHHYERFGLTREEFQRAFLRVGEVIADYAALEKIL